MMEVFSRTIELITSFDSDVMNAVGVSLKVSVLATAVAALMGIPLGFAIGIGTFRGKRALIVLFNTLLAVPTVVIGLMVFMMLTREGPFGMMELLFTPWAIVIGEAMLGFPIIVALSIAAAKSVDRSALETAISLGAPGWRRLTLSMSEARFAAIAAVIATFGRLIAEVGIALVAGGNIRGYSRTMTTAITLETGKGNLEEAIALGIILITVALIANIGLQYMQGKKA